MSFLAINGIPFPTGRDGHEEEIREIGGLVTSYGGVANKSLYAKTRNDMKLESAPMPDAEALAWEQLVRGYGESWSFNSDFKGSRGTSPTVTTGLSISGAAPLLLSTQRLSIAANNPVRFFNVSFTPGRWTVSVWRSTAASALSHYLVSTTGHKWVNGVRNDSAVTTWLQNFAGTDMRVNGDLVDVTNVDDLVILPFEIPDSWGPYFYQLYTTCSQQYPPLPKLTVSGDVFGTLSRTYLGNAPSSKPLRAGGGIRRRVSVQLTEA